MFTAEIKYLGNLRTEAKHVHSGNTLITDAPVDNHGKGEYFSPTDTVCSALGSCMLTLMGIAANAHQFELKEVKVEVKKYMESSPRRIVQIDIKIHFTQVFGPKERKILETAAINCPVAKSLHPEIKQEIEFYYPA